MSQERINEEINEELEKLKVGERMQAIFFNELCKEIKKSKNEILFPIKPNVQRFKNDAWIMSMQIVVEFLKTYNMEITLDTINIENKEKTKPLFFTHGKLGISIDGNAISNLIKSTEKVRKIKLKERIGTSISSSNQPHSEEEEYEEEEDI